MSENNHISRRGFLRATAALTVAGAAWKAGRSEASPTVWQLDPQKCQQCGRCAINCVLTPSAVKCVHTFQICGYCDLCSGYLQPGAKGRDTGAEHQLCPVSAIKRTFVEVPFYQYTIDETLCIGCGKCVKGCTMFGNGSLQLQIKQDLCVHCNDCAIARGCPSNAFSRVPADDPYLLKTRQPAGPSPS